MSVLVQHMAVEVERRILFERADHNHLLSEVDSEHVALGTRLFAATRRTSGRALIRVGTRLQGARTLESGIVTQAA